MMARPMHEFGYIPPEELISRYNQDVGRLKQVESLDNSGKMLDGARILLHQAITGKAYSRRLEEARRDVVETDKYNLAYVASVLPAYKDQAAAEARVAGKTINPI